MAEAFDFEPSAAPAARTVEWFGQDFELADKIGLMPLMRFAHLARAGVDSGDMEGLDAMYVLLKQCFTASAWQRFEDVASEQRAGGDELFGVVTKAIEAMSARPTGRPSGSSGGSQNANMSSAGVSSSPVTGLVERGRPDLALLVNRAEEYRASA